MPKRIILVEVQDWTADDVDLFAQSVVPDYKYFETTSLLTDVEYIDKWLNDQLNTPPPKYHGRWQVGGIGIEHRENFAQAFIVLTRIVLRPDENKSVYVAKWEKQK